MTSDLRGEYGGTEEGSPLVGLPTRGRVTTPGCGPPSTRLNSDVLRQTLRHTWVGTDTRDVGRNADPRSDFRASVDGDVLYVYTGGVWNDDKEGPTTDDVWTRPPGTRSHVLSGVESAVRCGSVSFVFSLLR